MSGFLTSSIGKKLIMSVTGLFLILFLLVHLSINVLVLFGNGNLYNEAAHFMVTNPLMKVMEPILVVGFIAHMIYGVVLTLQNRKARPIGYLKSDQSGNASFASRNMFVLGGLVLVFLVLHLMHFYAKVKFGEPELIMIDGEKMPNVYGLVAYLLVQPVYAGLYVLGSILLGFHLSHGFWSAFQSIGWSNDIWRKRLTRIGNIYAIVVAAGFALIPIILIIKLM